MTQLPKAKVLAGAPSTWLNYATMNVKLIRAFIASPAGLDAERKAAHEAAEEVNRSVALPLGGRLELIGWEDTLSGIGRPQELINADMDNCDLFIGAMWTKWGSRPSKDGPYTSGFEEEFERSRARHARTTSPVMAMFFKDVDPLQLSDPGEDLRKVLKFKDTIIAEKTFLFGTFPNSEEFSRKIREFLSVYVIKTLKVEAPPREEHPAQSTQSNALQTAQPETVAAQGSAQEANFLKIASESFRSKDGPSSASVARLRLIAVSAGRAGNDKQIVGVHDANLLYASRANFSFSFVEKFHLLACGLSNLENENVPVWSWLAELNRTYPGLLGVLTVHGEDVERVGALTAMQLLGEPLKSLAVLKTRGVSEVWLGSNTPTAVKVAALHYLRDYGTRSELHAVQQEAELAAKETVAIAMEAAVAILLRDDETKAARYLLSVSFETLSPGVVRDALAHLGELGSEELVLGLVHRSSKVRKRTIDVLSERKVLNIKTIERALEDDAPAVRLAAVRALDQLDQPQSLDEVSERLCRPRRAISVLGIDAGSGIFDERFFIAYRAERLRSMAVQPLKALLDAPGHCDAAYRELAARRIGEFGDRLRADLEDGFQRYLAEHWPDGNMSAIPILTNALTLGAHSPDEDKKRDLIRSALDVIAKQHDMADLSLVRRVLDTRGISPTITVIAYLAALGSTEDIARLAQTLQYSWTELVDEVPEYAFNAAARAIIRLFDGPFSQLVMLSMPNLMKARLIDLVSSAQFSELDDGIIVGLLLSDDFHIRRSAAKKAPGSLSRKRIAKVLSDYRANEKGGYYLVTYWLDLGLAYSRQISKRVVGNKK